MSNPLEGVRVAPSILAADFSRLGEQVREVLDAGARVIHVDIMDGHFVPSISMGPVVLSALAEDVHRVGGMLDVHLMVERPERQAPEFIAAGADSVSFHVEATPHVSYAANLIAERGARVGVALNPATPVSSLSEIADVIDIALCMTVNPGWGGQQFIASSPRKLSELHALLAPGIAIEVDGGIDADTAPLCRDAGARLFVAGSAIFNTPDPAAAYAAIATAIGAD